jgi:hypothetical protein
MQFSELVTCHFHRFPIHHLFLQVGGSQIFRIEPMEPPVAGSGIQQSLKHYNTLPEYITSRCRNGQANLLKAQAYESETPVE